MRGLDGKEPRLAILDPEDADGFYGQILVEEEDDHSGHEAARLETEKAPSSGNSPFRS